MGSQSESLICDFWGIVTEGFTIPETVFSKYILWKYVFGQVIQIELLVFDH